MRTVAELKDEVGEIPKETCDMINKQLKGMKYVYQDAIHYSKNQEGDFESFADNVQSILDDIENTLEELRESNSRLRNIGIFWYEQYKELAENHKLCFMDGT